jgi:hypothetical protein
LKLHSRLAMVTKPASTMQAMAGQSGIQGQPRLHSKNLSQNIINK